MATSEREHRGAIAVNNLGVALLEAGRVDSAIASLQDAVKLLKVGRDLSISVGPSSPLSLEVTMKRAAQRFALGDPASVESLPCASILAVSDNVDAAEMTAALQRPLPSHACSLFPIRLEPDSNEFCYESEEAILLSCTLILHNLGLALLLKSLTSKDEDATILQEKSIKLFQLCEKVIFSLGQSSHEDHHLQLKLLSVRGILSVSFIEALKVSGRHEDASFQKHRDFRASLANLRWPSCLHQSNQNAAAA